MPARRARAALCDLPRGCCAVSAATAGHTPNLPRGHTRPVERTYVGATEAHIALWRSIKVLTLEPTRELGVNEG